MGHKVSYEEIIPNQEYIQKRAEIRERIFQIKAPRRFHLGDFFTFLFENKDTVWYQIQEMLRAEGITEKNAILHEVETYNQLAPDKGEIKVTLLIEIDDEVFRKYKLKELVGLHEHVFFLYEKSDGTLEEIKGEFDDKQFNRERISSVQYITFKLNEEQQKEFLNTKKAGIKVTHPAYYYTGFFNEEQLNAIKEDFKKTFE
ncbi:MAG: fructose-bisphosphate aldolase [Leptospiraceae bacterium]|nr:MAG: fructose-bisphosphate aldolase [Leptospiraceae bacterium]